MTALFPTFTAPALCAESDTPDAWFPPADGRGNEIAARAKAVCRSCPALEECAEYAVPRASLDGIWGGLSARERAERRRTMPALRLPATQCAKGHDYTASNTAWTSRGRRCRTCHNLTSNRSKRGAA